MRDTCMNYRNMFCQDVKILKLQFANKMSVTFLFRFKYICLIYLLVQQNT